MHKSADDKKELDDLPTAVVKPSRLSWLLWLIPVGAAALCVWFAYHDYIAAGPEVTIYFKDGDGLEQENTPIRYRGATVGEVKEVVLTKDAKYVQVTARLAGSAAELARQGTVFWIVRPEVKVGAISGLRTIVSGEYIATQPGAGAKTNSFLGVEKEPIAPQPKALAVTLLAPSLGSLQKESPIFYRGIQVGEVLYYQLATNSLDVVIHARIWAEYAPLVRVDTKFWNAGGIDLHFGLFKGMQISAESPRTVLSGGIEFATPTAVNAPATNDMIFVLNEKQDDKWKTWSPAIALRLRSEAPAGRTNAPPPSPGSMLK